jgi:hypothetical protein
VLVLHAEIMELVSYHKTALIALVHGTFQQRSTKHMNTTKQEAIAYVQIILNLNQRNINAMTKVNSIISINYFC